MLAADSRFTEVAGLIDASGALEIARQRLDRQRLPDNLRDRVKLLHGALTYRDARTEGFDAAAVVEVIEHLDPPRLTAFARVLFGCTRPGLVVLTTPNREYNVRFKNLPAGKFRHADHFERTEPSSRSGVCRDHGYAVKRSPVGDTDPEVGGPSQMAVFRRQ